ncbi:uncharacterized protein LOC127781567 [Oryza glaberrima]|uniref:uncharacterized protein LOC127781567 n=1 Tax=Oryza glaberrima TaxID=4538 RepID=UPI00224BF813|nr:uncharacterized protein LOC127781567 [Oryza glaberrima]
MGSVEVAATWYDSGRESMRGGSGKGVNVREFRRGWRRGSHRGGSSPPAARCSARRRRLPRTSTSRNVRCAGGDNMQRETAPPDPDIAALLLSSLGRSWSCDIR